MGPTDRLTADARQAPYWWDAAAPVPAPPRDVPARADAVIIGSGFTGLSAALTLLRAGRGVVVLDSEDPGFGASRRNAGYLGRTLKKSFPALLAAHGIDYARAIYHDLDAALRTVREVIAQEGIDCHLVRCGRFIGATSAAHYESLARDLAVTKQHLGFDFAMLPRAEQHREMATDLYHGGAVIPDLGALHPGLYHHGLLARVVAAGGIVLGRTPAQALSHDGRTGRVVTPRGEIATRDIVVATNGYTPRHLRWHARRVIPFTAYMAATEELPREVFRRLLPQGRTVIDSNVNIDFIRPAPDSPRFLFGGATGSNLGSSEAIAERLSAILARIFPDLARTRLSHVWTGQCAGTFDLMPHMGRHEGIWYGLGYNFAGVPMGTFFGRRIAQRILGTAEAPSAFERPPPTYPFYTGNPWFVPLAMRWFDWHDRRA